MVYVAVTQVDIDEETGEQVDDGLAGGGDGDSQADFLVVTGDNALRGKGGGAAYFRLTGEAVKAPTTPWKATDGFTATIAFTFEAVKGTPLASVTVTVMFTGVLAAIPLVFAILIFALRGLVVSCHRQRGHDGPDYFHPGLRGQLQRGAVGSGPDAVRPPRRRCLGQL